MIIKIQDVLNKICQKNNSDIGLLFLAWRRVVALSILQLEKCFEAKTTMLVKISCLITNRHCGLQSLTHCLSAHPYSVFNVIRV